MNSKFILPFGDIFEKMNPDRVFVYDTDIEDNIKFKKIKLISLYDYHYDSYYLDDDIVDKIKKLCNLLIKKIKVETNNDYVNHIVDGLDIIFLQQHLDDKQYNFFQRIINLVLYFKTPAASSKMLLLSSALLDRISSTFPWLMIEKASFPRPESMKRSIISFKRTD